MPRRNGVLDNRRSSHPMLEMELTELRLTNEYFDGDPGYESFLTVQAQDVVIRDLIPSYGPWAAQADPTGPPHAHRQACAGGPHL